MGVVALPGPEAAPGELFGAASAAPPWRLNRTAQQASPVAEQSEGRHPSAIGDCGMGRCIELKG